MMRLAEIQSHVASMHELRDIVGAMRSLAGMRVQEAQRALPGIRSYAESMASAIAGALALLPLPVMDAERDAGRRALILCTAEHGFVGSFNERMVEAAVAVLVPTDLLFVLGSRGAALALERGREIAWTAPTATRLAGATDAVSRLTNELYERIARGGLSRVEVMFSRDHRGAASTIERRVLLPLDTVALGGAAKAANALLHNLPPRALLEKLAAEYVFALLTEAAVESLASENAARFAAMESAHENVSKKLAALEESEREVRQAEITSELLDLLIGAEVTQPAPPRR